MGGPTPKQFLSLAGLPILVHSLRVLEHADAVTEIILTVPPADRELAHGQRIAFGGCTFEIRHAPGHSPGHVILYAAADGLALVGDVVFAGSIGRTDLPGGDFRTLIASIRREVFTLPPATRLLSGHGKETTVEWEARHNPFLIPHYGGDLA